MMQSSRVFNYDFDIPPGATSTTNILFNACDLSHAEALLLELRVTKAEDDVDDLLDIYFQETVDGTIWYDRARFTTLLGNITVSVGAPEIERLTLNQVVDLASTEERYEPSGSSGGAHITAGSVVNGPFSGKRRTSDGWLPNFRFSIVVTDAAQGDAEFEGNLKVWALSRA